MRCPDCSKFVSLDFEQEPEVNEEQFNAEDGGYSIEVRIVRTCADCGQELKEATINFEGEIDDWDEIKAAHEGEGHEFEMTVEAQNDERYEGKGRYTKSFFGAAVEISITCGCSTESIVSMSLQPDHVQASHMDEMV